MERITQLGWLLHRPLVVEARGGVCLDPHHGPLVDPHLAPPIDWFSRDLPAGGPFRTAYNREPLVFEHGWGDGHLRELWLYAAGEPDDNGMADLRGQLVLVVPVYPPGVPAAGGPVVIPPGGLQVFASSDGLVLQGFSPIPSKVPRMPVPGWTMREFIYGASGFDHTAVLYLDTWGRIAGCTVIDPSTKAETHWAFDGPMAGPFPQ